MSSFWLFFLTIINACIGSTVNIEKWLIESEVITNSINLRWKDSSGWGWVTTNNIPKGREIMLVPSDSMMWADVKLLENYKSLLSEDSYQTASMIISLLSAGEKYQDYVMLLQNSTQRQIPLLRDENNPNCMCEELLEFRENMLKEITTIYEVLSMVGTHSKSDIEWGYRVVLERAFVYDQRIALVPAGDFLNQKLRNLATTWSFTSVGMSLKTLLPMKEGEEVFIDYRNGVSAMDAFKKYGYKSRGSGKVLIPLGLPLQGREDFINQIQTTDCIQDKLFVDSTLGKASGELLKCSAVAVLPNRPEAEVFFQNENQLPQPIKISISIASLQHVILMIDSVIPRYITPNCHSHTEFTKDGETAAMYVIKELNQSKKALEIRIIPMTKQWDSLMKGELGVVWKKHQIHISGMEGEL